MLNSFNHPSRLAACLALVLIPVGAVATMTTAKQSQASRHCEIRVTPETGMVRLEALVHPDRHAAGTYTFRVEKVGGGGSSTTSQGGNFDASSGQTAVLSSVALGGKGADYKATLDVTIGGETFRCTKQNGDD